MRKKILLIFLSLLLLLAIPVTLFVVSQQQELRQKAAPATTLSLSPEQNTKTLNDEFQMNVVINTGENSIVQVVVGVEYDASKLQFLSILNSQNFPNPINDPGSNPNGQIEYIVATINPQTPFKGTGNVATIRFKAIAGTTTPTTVKFTTNAAAYSLSEQTIPPGALIGTTPATITISGSGTNPTPTPTLIIGSPTATPSGSITPTTTLQPTVATSPTSGTLNLTLTSPSNGSSTSDTTPTLSGTAKAGTAISILFTPGGSTGTATANASGTWTYTPATALGRGVYTITLTGTNPTNGATQSVNSTITIGTINATATPIPTQRVSQSPTVPTEATEDVPVTGNVSQTVMIVLVGLLLLIGGALVPIFIH